MPFSYLENTFNSVDSDLPTQIVRSVISCSSWYGSRASLIFGEGDGNKMVHMTVQTIGKECDGERERRH